MKICLVSAFPPSRRGLNEYGFHIARELQQDPLLSLTVLADELESPQPELAEFDVHRGWRFNRFSNLASIVRAVGELKPVVVWLNLLFCTFGDQPAKAFACLAAPALSGVRGHYTQVTVHHLMANLNLQD